MTTLYIFAGVAIPALILTVVCAVLLRRNGAKARTARSVARRMVHEVRREAVRGTFEQRQAVPAKVAFIKRYCAERRIPLHEVGTNERELERCLARVDTKSPDAPAKAPMAFIPLRETELTAGGAVFAPRLTPPSQRGRAPIELPPDPEPAHAPLGEIELTLDEPGLLEEEVAAPVAAHAKAPESGARPVGTALSRPSPRESAPAEVRQGLAELGEDGIDDFIETAFDRATTR